MGRLDAEMGALALAGIAIVFLVLALIGVLYLTINYGQFPWIALTLAGSFGLYGYIRKTARLGATDGFIMTGSAKFRCLYKF